MTDSAIADNWIELRLPVAREYARLLRLVVSGMAGRLDFDIDSVDDIKIAVEEAYLMAIACDHTDSVLINLRYEDGALDVVFRDILPAKDSQTEELRKQIDYGMFIIEAVVDDTDFSEGPQGTSLRLVKKPVASDGGFAV